MRKLIVLALAFAIPAGTALAAPASIATTRTVKVGDNFYVKDGGRPTVSVTRGQTVKWIWRGQGLHDVKVKTGPRHFHSRLQTSGTYSHRLSVRGTYLIYCSVHGVKDMSMTLRVK